jgi:transcriptional regulator with XRE-family HTH domain
VPRTRTTQPLPDELRRLVDEHGVSLRAVAEAIGVNQSYLSRILGPKGRKSSRTASAGVAEAIAGYFGLPADYFGEYREAVVMDAVAADPKLRDRVYDSLKRR